MAARSCFGIRLGYKGRIAIHEILVMNEEMKKVILNDEPISKLRELAVRNKTIFLVDDGLLKVKQGQMIGEIVEFHVDDESGAIRTLRTHLDA